MGTELTCHLVHWSPTRPFLSRLYKYPKGPSSPNLRRKIPSHTIQPIHTTMSTRPCKVIIAGGGVAGLSLALMLEKYGIDFLLLEAYSDILPKAGGGLCMLPNGLRILDQLGCYEDMVKRGKQPVKSVDFRNAKGESLVSTPEFEKKCGGRCVLPI